MDDLITVKQAAILLKVHPLTIRRYINEGKLKAIRVAGNVRISQSDIRSFQESYIPQQKHSKQSPAQNISQNTSPFAANDSLFRLRGRGISLEQLK